jgi:glutamate racemase
MANDLPIGVFDSGMGGLTVLRELMQELPNESFIYLGDTARLPYGTKSVETVKQYAFAMTDLLYQQGIKMLVIACNTATASALPFLQQQFPALPIIGVIEPGANAAVSATKNKDILLLATETTINSQAYHTAMIQLDPTIKIQTQACGLFVALAEEGCVNDAVSAEVIKKYLSQYEDANCDTVILGCTHFPVFIDEIQSFFNRDVTIINSAYETAVTVKKVLQNLLLEIPQTASRSMQYYVTDLPDRFIRVSHQFLDLAVEDSDVELITHRVKTEVST